MPIVKVDLHRKYTKEEDEILLEAIKKGHGWTYISKHLLPTRSASSIKQRYNLMKPVSTNEKDGPVQQDMENYPSKMKRQHLDQSSMSLSEEYLNTEATDKIFLDSKYDDKDEVKTLGAQYDPIAKKWWINSSQDMNKFSKWLPKKSQTDSLPNPNISTVNADVDEISMPSIDYKNELTTKPLLTDLLSVPALSKLKEGIDNMISYLSSDLKTAEKKNIDAIKEASQTQARLDEAEKANIEAVSYVKKTEAEIRMIEQKLKQLRDMFM